MDSWTRRAVSSHVNNILSDIFVNIPKVTVQEPGHNVSTEIMIEPLASAFRERMSLALCKNTAERELLKSINRKLVLLLRQRINHEVDNGQLHLNSEIEKSKKRDMILRSMEYKSVNSGKVLQGVFNKLTRQEDKDVFFCALSCAIQDSFNKIK